jgi:TRAP-type mannitol/chloroaromatic compound transport system substrate-binding protein
VGAAAVAAPAIAQSMPEIKWRMPTSCFPDHPVVGTD